MLSDHFAQQAMFAAGGSHMTEAFKAVGLHNAMYIIPLLTTLAALVLFAATTTVEKDMRRPTAT
jgi:hypothetical protein